MASSLEHLGTDHVDSYVLHGPASGHGWTVEDAEVWAAMVGERDATVVRLNQEAMSWMRGEVQLAIVPGATHLFEEPGALEQVGELAGRWFELHLSNQ